MKLSILQYGDPILRAKGERVDKIDNRIRELAAKMIETMHAANGVGLAAQQVGEALQLTVIDVSHVEDRPSAMKRNGEDVDLGAVMPLVLINPDHTEQRNGSWKRRVLEFSGNHRRDRAGAVCDGPRAKSRWRNNRVRGDRITRARLATRSRSSQRHSFYRPDELRGEGEPGESIETTAERNAERPAVRSTCTRR